MADQDILSLFDTLDLMPPVAIEEPASEIDVTDTEPAWSDGWERNLAGLAHHEGWEAQLAGLAQLMDWRP